MILHNKYVKWMSELGADFCPGLYDFGLQHQEIYKLTNIPKFRSFQYRLIQRGIVTNIQLEKWNILESSGCSFCNQYVEEVIHLFATCPVITNFWAEFVIYVSSRFNVRSSELDLRASAIIFNRVTTRKYHVINFLVLVAKQFIYRCRCMKESVIFNVYRRYIKQIEAVEKYIAVKNGKLAMHHKKWAPFVTTLNISQEIVQYVENM